MGPFGTSTEITAWLATAPVRLVEAHLLVAPPRVRELVARTYPIMSLSDETIGSFLGEPLLARAVARNRTLTPADVTALLRFMLPGGPAAGTVKVDLFITELVDAGHTEVRREVARGLWAHWMQQPDWRGEDPDGRDEIRMMLTLGWEEWSVEELEVLFARFGADSVLARLLMQHPRAPRSLAHRIVTQHAATSVGVQRVLALHPILREDPSLAAYLEAANDPELYALAAAQLSDAALGDGLRLFGEQGLRKLEVFAEALAPEALQRLRPAAFLPVLTSDDPHVRDYAQALLGRQAVGGLSPAPAAAAPSARTSATPHADGPLADAPLAMSPPTRTGRR